MLTGVYARLEPKLHDRMHSKFAGSPQNKAWITSKLTRLKRNLMAALSKSPIRGWLETMLTSASMKRTGFSGPT
jgi:hypothetical protein